MYFAKEETLFLLGFNFLKESSYPPIFKYFIDLYCEWNDYYYPEEDKSWINFPNSIERVKTYDYQIYYIIKSYTYGYKNNLLDIKIDLKDIISGLIYEYELIMEVHYDQWVDYVSKKYNLNKEKLKENESKIIEKNTLWLEKFFEEYFKEVNND